MSSGLNLLGPDPEPTPEPTPVPFWAVVHTRTHHLVAWSESMAEDVGYVGHDCYDVMSETPPEGGEALFMLFEGTMRHVPGPPCDGDLDGYEFETRYDGTWRPLTSEEAVALAAGYFEPGIDDEVLNHVGTFQKHIRGALKSIITAHGPITMDLLGSATKRMLGAIRDWNQRAREHKALKAHAKTMDGKCWACGQVWGTTEDCAECAGRPR